jgi:sarcosine oxidase
LYKQENMYDAVVLGLGGVGSFAIRALSKQKGVKVLGIERFSRGHTNGSSHGKSRVYRRAYFEHSNYVPWLNFSIQEFLKLEEETKIPIVKQCGVLLAEEAGGDMLHAASASAKEHDIPTETLTVDQLRARFPQYRYQDNMAGLFEPGAGMVRPEKATGAALQQAEENGATIWETTQVNNFREVLDQQGNVEHVEIVVEREGGEVETISTKTVLVAAGAWTSRFIPSYAPHLKVTRQLQTWVDISALEDSDIYQSSQMPAFAVATPEWPRPMFCLPADELCDDDKYKNCVKLGIHGRDVPTDPDQNPAFVTPAELEEMRGAIQVAFNPEAGSQPFADTWPCMYTQTVDDHFLIGVPKGYQKVCAVAGLSGHGFKLTPALGQMLADFGLGKGLDKWNAGFCSPSRFGV